MNKYSKEKNEICKDKEKISRTYKRRRV